MSARPSLVYVALYSMQPPRNSRSVPVAIIESVFIAPPCRHENQSHRRRSRYRRAQILGHARMLHGRPSTLYDAHHSVDLHASIEPGPVSLEISNGPKPEVDVTVETPVQDSVRVAYVGTVVGTSAASKRAVKLPVQSNAHHRTLQTRRKPRLERDPSGDIVYRVARREDFEVCPRLLPRNTWSLNCENFPIRMIRTLHKVGSRKGVGSRSPIRSGSTTYQRTAKGGSRHSHE